MTKISKEKTPARIDRIFKNMGQKNNKRIVPLNYFMSFKILN